MHAIFNLSFGRYRLYGGFRVCTYEQWRKRKCLR